MKLNLNVDDIINKMVRQAKADHEREQAQADAKAEATALVRARAEAQKKANIVANKESRLEEAKKRQQKGANGIKGFLAQIAHLIPQYAPSEGQKVNAGSPSMRLTIFFYKGDAGAYSAQIISNGKPIMTLPAASIRQLDSDKHWKMDKLKRELDLDNTTETGLLEEIKRLRNIQAVKEELDELRGE